MIKHAVARIACFLATLLFVVVALDLLVVDEGVGFVHGLGTSLALMLLAVAAAMDAEPGRSA
jgi:hypothetical protein